LDREIDHKIAFFLDDANPQMMPMSAIRLKIGLGNLNGQQCADAFGRRVESMVMGWRSSRTVGPGRMYTAKRAVTINTGLVGERVLKGLGQSP